MTAKQGYVSNELTHFVAAPKETAEEQYAVLVQILRSGWLTTTPKAPGSPKALNMMPGAKMSRNRMYHRGAICFCDIPVDDFGIHIAKYSPFGLAFRKTYLLGRGVNPVFYLANDSIIGKRVVDGKVTDEDVKRAELIDWMALGIYYRFAEGVDLLQKHQDLPQPVREFLLKYQQVDNACLHHLLAYMKPFNVAQDDADPDNYYMEREWRAASDVQFAVSDVCRIILPKAWEGTFRSDFPDYAGPVEHAPEGIVRIPRAPYVQDPEEVGMMMTIGLARKDSGEKSKVAMRYGPVGQGYPALPKDGETPPEGVIVLEPVEDGETKTDADASKNAEAKQPIES